jgi:ribosomal protein L11 methyltransferase
MKHAALWQVTVATSPEAEDAVAALLEKLFKQTPSVYVAEETKTPAVTVYATKSRDKSRSLFAALEQGLHHLVDCGLDIGARRVTVRKVTREEWSESWKKFFKPIEIGRVLLIKPSWSKRRPRKSQGVIVLDPGLSFGTGQHPTTAFCLEQMESARKLGRGQSFLDIGTGSGILAIAAAKLGYRPVQAFDIDPVSIRVARANARRNRVGEIVSITRQDLSRLTLLPSRRYDLICANLISTVLLQESRRILNRLRPGGRLVLAGILASEFSRVRQAYESAGLNLVATKAGGEWKSGAFEKPRHQEPKVPRKTTNQRELTRIQKGRSVRAASPFESKATESAAPQS